MLTEMQKYIDAVFTVKIPVYYDVAMDGYPTKVTLLDAGTTIKVAYVDSHLVIAKLVGIGGLFVYINVKVWKLSLDSGILESHRKLTLASDSEQDSKVKVAESWNDKQERLREERKEKNADIVRSHRLGRKR